VGIVVQKYGGSSVADVARIEKVADRVAATRARGQDVVVVVSAMGDTTDELLALARRITDRPARRELDMLLSAGERISMALLGVALNARGVPVITNDSHTSARIVEVRPFRVQDELATGKVVIVAGYQGVSYKKEVTTLGRGGSDTTAVALAAALGAEACEIYSDVDGVYSADPRVVPGARRLSEISYEEMQEMAEAGAKVLNAQAVEFAKEAGIAIYARASSGSDAETVVRRFPPRAPGRVAGIASETGLMLLQAGPMSRQALADALAALDERGVAGKQLQSSPDRDGHRAAVVLSLENLHDLGAHKDALAARGFRFMDGLGAVSAIGTGINATFANVRRALEVLAERDVAVLGVATSSFRISVLVEERAVQAAVRDLHERLVEAAPA
jgi:aspartate kinase